MEKSHLQPNFVSHENHYENYVFLNAIFQVFLQMEKDKSQAAQVALVRKHKQMACI